MHMDKSAYHRQECGLFAKSHREEDPIKSLDSRDKLLNRLRIAINEHHMEFKEYETVYGEPITFNVLNGNPMFGENREERVENLEQLLVSLTDKAESNNLFEMIWKPFSLNFPSYTLLQLAQKLDSNSYDIVIDGKPIATGLYVSISSIYHSCNPNSALMPNGMKLELRAIREFDRNFEPVSISRVQCLNVREGRQKDLLRIYGDLCDCLRCSSEPNDDEVIIGLQKLYREQVEWFMAKNWHKFYDAGMARVDVCRKVLSRFHPEVVQILLQVFLVVAEQSKPKKTHTKKNIEKRVVDRMAADVRECIQVVYHPRHTVYKFMAIVHNVTNSRYPFVGKEL